MDLTDKLLITFLELYKISTGASFSRKEFSSQLYLILKKDLFDT